MRPWSLFRLRCPGCHQNALRSRHRLLTAVRAQSRCPACGIAIRFGFWPRLIHSLFGDAVLLGGVVGAFLWQAPFLLPLAASSWLSLALFLPVQPDLRDPITRRRVARS